jgi:hypothetical protein
LSDNVITLDFVRGRLSPTERSEIGRLADRGLKPGQIALRLQRHPATVNFHMVTHGLRTMQSGRRGVYERNGITVAGFTRDEDVFIEALRVQGYTYEKIAEVAAKRFGHKRSAATIGVRLKMLASV